MVEPNNKHISENEETISADESSKPVSEVATPVLICGAVGALFTITLSLVGWYDGVDLGLMKYYKAEPFYMDASSGWHAAWDWLLVMLLTFGISFAVLDTDKQWRRVLIILLASVVVLLSSPVLMLWDVFWSPTTVYVGMLWSWICAFIYGVQHTMPCELALPPETEEGSEGKGNSNESSSCLD